MKVLKFGGSSVASADRMRGVVDILTNKNYGKEERIYVVCSAMSGMTDLLLSMSAAAAIGDLSYKASFQKFAHQHIDTANNLLSGDILATALSDLKENHDNLEKLLEGIYLIKEVSKRTADYVLGFGERNSCYLIAKYLSCNNQSAHYLDARKVLRTNDDYGAALVNFETSNENINKFDQNTDNQYVIVTGFIASNEQGIGTTLGRGGSDYTASIFAAALEAEQLEIWTDVNGVLTTDPRKVKSAYSVPELDYREAMELSHFGAKVIYPPTIKPVCDLGIPLYIKNTFEPDHAGTRIASIGDNSSIKGISSIGEVALVTLEGSGLAGVTGMASRLFSCLAETKVNVIMITQASSEYSICFAIKQSDLAFAKAAINKAYEREIDLGILDPIRSEINLSILAIVGKGMISMPGVAGKVFGTLGKNGINIKAIAQGSSELNISFVVKGTEERKALNVVHDEFFLARKKRLNLFVVGPGLIGSTLLKQIEAQHDKLLAEHNLDIKVIGIARSKVFHVEQDGIDLNNWADQLTTGTISEFVDHMIELDLQDSIFVDCTASEIVPTYYKRILEAAIAISTPNKVASSSNIATYNELKAIAKKMQVAYSYETNVGAGLPVLTTIRSLVQSGDKITSIQAVLSGSCSYIFNNFSNDRSFHDVVLEAKEMGLTEPDPRDDLSGKDVQRKIVILAREAGIGIELADVALEPFLPEVCSKCDSVEGFMASLIENNTLFNNMLSDTHKLRLTAELVNGKAKVGLVAVDNSSPFYNLQDSDNMLVIKSKRYNKRPLVVSGPGAGAEVTAAGVFAEIISMK